MKSSVIKLLLMGCLLISGLAVADTPDLFVVDDGEIDVTEAFVEQSVGDPSPYFPVKCRLPDGRPVFKNLPSSTVWAVTLITGSYSLINPVQFVDVNADGFADLVVTWTNGVNVPPNYYRAIFINYGGNGWIMDACNTNVPDAGWGFTLAPCGLLTPNPNDKPCN